jgi:hypothetical protein
MYVKLYERFCCISVSNCCLKLTEFLLRTVCVGWLSFTHRLQSVGLQYRLLYYSRHSRQSGRLPRSCSLRLIDGGPEAGYVKVNLNDRVGSRTHVLPQFPLVSAAHPKFIPPPYKTHVCLRVDCSYGVQAQRPKRLIRTVIDSRDLQFPLLFRSSFISFDRT